MKQAPRAWVAWPLCVLYAAAIWVGSSLESPSLPSLGRIPVDKVLHALAYGLLSGLLLWAMSKGRTLSARMAVGAAFVATGYGVIDEVHQAFVRGREATLGDAVADMVGATLVAAFALAGARRRGVGTPRRT